MLRTFAIGSRSHGAERVASSSSRHFSARPTFNFGTWLDAHHLPRNHLCHSYLTLGGDASLATGSCVRSFATRFATSTSTGRELEEPRLPRYIRRQQLRQKGSETEAPKRNGLRSDGAFRSKHYDPEAEKPEGEIKKLEPYVLAGRLKKLCDAGKLEDAVFMLKNSPLDAQSPPVWNTLIWECLKGQRYQLAYRLYIDMKRRGFSPTTRTYQTMFNGLSKIDDWIAYPKQLANARALYEAFNQHIESLKKSDSNSPELSPDPLSGYIRILGSAGCYQELFDVYYSLPQEGRLAPNTYTFTAMFQALNASKMGSAVLGEKVAADARLLWTQMSRLSNKKHIDVDSHMASAAIVALASGNATDHELAFQIVKDYFGLSIGQTKHTFSRVPLQPESFAAVLKLCNQSKKFAYCSQFLLQVKQRPEKEGDVSIVDRGHMEDILRADLALSEPGLGTHAVETIEWMLRQELTGPNGGKIRPALSTYSLAMQACWKDADWKSATRIFELMTGYHAHDFMDGAVAERPRLDKRGAGRTFSPNAEILSSMLRTTLVTRSRAEMRQALRIVHYLGFEDLMKFSIAQSKRASRHSSFFGQKFASAVVEAVDVVLEENGRYAKPDEAEKWRNLRQLAKAEVVKPSSSKPRSAAATNDRTRREREPFTPRSRRY